MNGETRQLRKNLREIFGLEKLRPPQRAVIERVLDGEDTLAIMPTGAGKSLCYQLPALQMEGMTIIVSPLISLMKDQSDKLAEKGLEVANLNSSVSESDQRDALAEVAHETSDFIFTTPERLINPEFLQTIKDKTIDFVVIDEAHCISQWGHDFRPAFLEIRRALAELKNPPVLALTATATPEVIEDIKKQLARPQMEVINSGIFRPNLRFEVLNTTSDHEKRLNLLRLLSEIEGSKIIYCATVKAVDEITDFLRQSGFPIEKYHGKLSPKDRTATQDRFMSSETETIAATNAFGMGVDKPDIRAVVHWQIPGSLESYYQEAGRAGRDDEEARCILLFDTRDKRTQQFFLGGKYPTADDILEVTRALENLNQAAKLEQIQETIGDAVAKTKTRVALNLLKDEKIVKERRGARFELVKADLTDEQIREIAKDYVERGETDREKLERMMFYAQSAFCRWQVLSKYFTVKTEDAEKCGTCDNCANPAAERFGIELEPQTARSTEKELLAQIREETNAQPKIEPGQIVHLPVHGEAEVAAVNGDKITVKLPNGETKIFKKEFVETNS